MVMSLSVKLKRTADFQFLVFFMNKFDKAKYMRIKATISNSLNEKMNTGKSGKSKSTMTFWNGFRLVLIPLWHSLQIHSN